jgi:hypothetical protein
MFAIRTRRRILVMTLVSRFSHRVPTMLMTTEINPCTNFPFSHRGCDILWNYDLREAAVGAMPDQGEGRSL